MGNEKNRQALTGMNLCRNICALTDELHDHWLRHQSSGNIRQFMNLTISQHRMLRTIWRMTAAEPDGVILRDLAQKLGLSSSAVSVMVENLVQRGYLLRTNAVHDRRKVLIRLSDNGADECSMNEEFWRELNQDFLGHCDPEKLKCFEEVIEDFISFLTSKKGEQK